MKKFGLVVFSLLLMTLGCENIMNTPTKKVEEFLNKYQRNDSEVISQLDAVVNDGGYSFNETQSNSYKELMKKQYKDLTYIIKEEMIDGNNATVTVEIEVYDFNKTLNDTENYYISNPDEFKTESGEADTSKYIEYKLSELQKVTDRIKYTLNLTLSKQNKEWIMNNITETDRQKIHGIYNS